MSHDLSVDDLLTIMMEECGEVIQAAAKCVRFGYDREHLGYGINHEVLAAELGDLLGTMDGLPLDQNIIANARKTKLERANKAKQRFGRADSR